MIKLGSCFTGIGAWEKSLKDLKIEYNLQWYFEFDKFPSCSYSAIHEENEEKNKGDITKANVKELKDIDLLVYSPPCQAFSIAGKQGGTKDPRGMMFYHTLPIIKEKKPKILVMENVKGLTNGKFKDLFTDMKKELENLGYKNYWKVLNAKDYGIPQNRERVFLVSFRNDLDIKKFEFPKPFDNGLRLKDFLENNVDEKFYISQEKYDKFIQNLNDKIIMDKLPKSNELKILDTTQIMQVGLIDIKGNEQVRRVYLDEGLRPTLNTMQGGNRQPKVMVKEATKKGYAIANVGDSINLEQPNSKTRRGRVGNQVAQTLTCSCNQATLETDYKIRKLTPKECWRLQGFTDENFEKAKKALNDKFYNGKDRSDSQLYKQAGNSICTCVTTKLFEKIFEAVEV